MKTEEYSTELLRDIATGANHHPANPSRTCALNELLKRERVAQESVITRLRQDALEARDMMRAGEFCGAGSLLWDMGKDTSSPNVADEPRR